jgi:hypothetical protein
MINKLVLEYFNEIRYFCFAIRNIPGSVPGVPSKEGSFFSELPGAITRPEKWDTSKKHKKSYREREKILSHKKKEKLLTIHFFTQNSLMMYRIKKSLFCFLYPFDKQMLVL